MPIFPPISIYNKAHRGLKHITNIKTHLLLYYFVKIFNKQKSNKKLRIISNCFFFPNFKPHLNSIKIANPGKISPPSNKKIVRQRKKMVCLTIFFHIKSKTNSITPLFPCNYITPLFLLVRLQMMEALLGQLSI